MIYVFDVEHSYVTSLKKAGLDIEIGYFGYCADAPLLVSIEKPPHEAKAFIYNLTKPACFDRSDWGVGGNSNYDCKIVKNPDDSVIHIGSSSSHIETYPRFQLISNSQIEHIRHKSKFGIGDVLKAVFEGGVPLIIFLNPEHAKHAPHRLIDWLDIDIQCSLTTANKVFIPQNILSSYPFLGKINTDVLPFTMPLRVKCTKFSKSYSAKKINAPVTVVTNNVNDIFCQFIIYGKGVILFSPTFEDPVGGTRYLLEVVPLIAKTYLDYQNRLMEKAKAISLQAQTSPAYRQFASSVTEVIRNFEKCAHRIQHRRAGKAVFTFDDEYDVQDILWVMLASYYVDIVYEDSSEKKAEKSSKPDFRIPSIKTVIEVKYADKQSDWKKIKEQIAADITQYEQAWPGNYQIFVVYDSQNVIPNKEKIKQDYRKSHSKVFIEFLP